MEDEKRVTGEGGGNRGQFLPLPEASLGSLLTIQNLTQQASGLCLKPPHTALMKEIEVAIINLGFGLVQGVLCKFHHLPLPMPLHFTLSQKAKKGII